MLYASVGSEVVTWGIALEILARASRTYYPRVEGGEIEAYEVASPAPDLLPRGKYRIPEPHRKRCRRADPSEVDLVLVPGLVFDLAGHRLGYGKGYFDRFLPRLRSGVPMLGLAYEMQMVRCLPACPWDYPVAAVVTEKRTFRERHARWITKSEEETIFVGESVGRMLLDSGFMGASVVIGLIGPLGAGKTCLVRGIARGLGCPGGISSPTFTLEHEYLGGSMRLRHFDLYRLTARRTLEDTELFEERVLEPGVTVVEWAERWLDLLPLDAILVEIEPRGSTERAVKVSVSVEDQHPLLEQLVETIRERHGTVPC